MMKIRLDWLADSLFGKPKSELPDIFSKALVVEPPKPVQKKAKAPAGKIHPVSYGGVVRRFMEVPPTGLCISEWVNLDLNGVQIETDRVQELTRFDIEELRRDRLDIEKAKILKEMWADELTNSQIVKAINKQRRLYGFQESTVKKYTVCFSRAVKRERKARQKEWVQIGSNPLPTPHPSGGVAEKAV